MSACVSSRQSYSESHAWYEARQASLVDLFFRVWLSQASASDALRSGENTGYNEPGARVEARVLVFASEGLIKESAAAPGRWMIA